MRRPVQLRHETPLSSEAYLAERAWVKASLAVCPRHPAGGCGFARHGTYPRKTPTGMRVTRYYCPTAHETFSLLPDCLASRFPSDLDDLERVVMQVSAASSVEAAADRLRLDIDLPSAVRWVRRRLTLVRASLVIAAGRVGPGPGGRDARRVPHRLADRPRPGHPARPCGRSPAPAPAAARIRPTSVPAAGSRRAPPTRDGG